MSTPPRSSVLDKGYVSLVDHLGDDISVVNAARVSFDKRSDWEPVRRQWTSDDVHPGWRQSDLPIIGKKLRRKDESLLEYLMEHNHTSPLRHCMLTFEVYAPMVVKNQWYKHVIGGHASEQNYDPSTGWNESSRRYVTEEPEFYFPDQWRMKAEDKKQGSGGPAEDYLQAATTFDLQYVVSAGMSHYKNAMEKGICEEQARLFLPAYAMYVRWWWTTSLQSILHFLDLRESPDAQWEIQEYAKAIKPYVQENYPYTYKSWEVFRKNRG